MPNEKFIPWVALFVRVPDQMETMKKMAILTFATLPFLAIAMAFVTAQRMNAQSADWQSAVWREPQVRYLLADLALGGNPALYRDYAEREKDPDSREAIRRWDSGVKVLNLRDFERRWLTHQLGKEGRVMRVVQRGSNRTITGNEVLLNSDQELDQAVLREAMGVLSLGGPQKGFAKRASREPGVAEALRRFDRGDRAMNTNQFELSSTGTPHLVYRGGLKRFDPYHVRLLSDLTYPETNVRYFLADMHLGGSRDFYHRVAESAHEMGCQEAVARYDAGIQILNLDQFERKQVAGKTLITRKGSDERICGMQVKLSTD